MIDLTKKTEYHYKAGASVHEYFEKLIKFLIGLGIPDFTRETMIKMLKVDKVGQLGKVGLGYDYMALQYANKPVTNLDYIRIIHDQASGLLKHGMATSKLELLIGENPCLSENESIRAKAANKIALEVLQKAHQLPQLIIRHAPVGVFIYLAKKLCGSTSGTRLSSTLEEVERSLVGNNIDKDWKSKTTLAPYNSFEASGEQMAGTGKLFAKDLTSVWVKKFCSPAKIDFL